TPAALAADRHLDRLVPRRAQSPCYRGAGAQRDIVLGGAAAGKARALHPASPSSSDALTTALPTVIVTVAPGSSSRPGGGNWSSTRPIWPWTSVSSSSTLGVRPALRISSTASRRSLPITFGTFAVSSS